MATITSGPYPVFNNKFKIGKAGSTSADADMVIVKEMETFSVSIDGTIEDWTPMDEEGWVKRMATGKGYTISMSGKRYVGDPGNDYIAGLAWKTGVDLCSKLEWEMPSGAKLTGDIVIDVKTPGGGDSTNVDKIEFDILGNGKPTYTPASSAIS